MISNKERREVAERLRSASARRDDTPWLVEDLMQALGFRCYEDGEDQLFDRLADLIDRPTCDVRMGVTGHIGVCTRCGAMVEMRAAVFDALEALPTRYCPNCGAEVVE